MAGGACGRDLHGDIGKVCVCVEGAAVFVARFFAIGDLLVSSEDVG